MAEAIQSIEAEEVECTALCMSHGYILYYDPSGIAVTEWMRRHHAWNAPMEAAAFVVAMGVITRDMDPQIVAGVALHHYTGEDVEMGLAVSDPAAWSRRFVKYVFDYCFNMMQVTRVTARVAVDNIESMELIERIGFTKEGTIRKYQYGVDHAVYGMLHEECKWLTSARGN